jgi:hypothetical protein
VSPANVVVKNVVHVPRSICAHFDLKTDVNECSSWLHLKVVETKKIKRRTILIWQIIFRSLPWLRRCLVVSSLFADLWVVRLNPVRVF